MWLACQSMDGNQGAYQALQHNTLSPVKWTCLRNSTVACRGTRQPRISWNPTWSLMVLSTCWIGGQDCPPSIWMRYLIVSSSPWMILIGVESCYLIHMSQWKLSGAAYRSSKCCQRGQHLMGGYLRRGRNTVVKPCAGSRLLLKR